MGYCSAFRALIDHQQPTMPRQPGESEDARPGPLGLDMPDVHSCKYQPLWRLQRSRWAQSCLRSRHGTREHR